MAVGIAVSWAVPQPESRKAGGKTGDDALQALDARAAFIVGDILSDNMARPQRSARTACWPRVSGRP
jgi:predicted RNase H-like HicB family nuclease